jgi:Ser/Thr protein kinase RdoA (MazF antagonist)
VLPGGAYEAACARRRVPAAARRLRPGARRPRDSIPAFHDTPAASPRSSGPRAPTAWAAHAAARREIDAVLGRRALAHLLLDARERGEAPERVVHNDAKLANVLLDARTGAGLCVVDLDTVMPGLSPYDFGDLARSAASAAPETSATSRA